MAKVLWAADRRVVKDDGTPASGGTLTIRLADTSTTATAYTDRALSTEQSVFTIGSDGYLQNRPTIYGADDVGYDAYVSSTGVNGSTAWTIPDLSIADSSASDVTDSEQAFKNLIANGAFDVWSSTTSWSNISGDNDGDETALGWFFAQPSAASNAISRQTALRTGARYGLRFGRPAASSSTNKLRLWGMLPTEAAIRARGQTVTISFNAHKGADFSGGSLGVKIATGTASGEDGDNIESGGFTGHTAPLNTAQSIDVATARYEFQATIGALVSELGFQFSYTPSGTAGADDWVQVEDVQIEIAAAATAFASTPEQVSFLIEELTSYARQLLQTTAFGGALSMSGTTLQVTAAAILAQLLTVDGAGSGLDADLLDGANIGTSGATLGLLNANKTDSGNNTHTGTNLFQATVTHRHLVPEANVTYDLGSAASFVRNIYAQTIELGNGDTDSTLSRFTGGGLAIEGVKALTTATGAQLAAANLFTANQVLSSGNPYWYSNNTAAPTDTKRWGWHVSSAGTYRLLPLLDSGGEGTLAFSITQSGGVPAIAEFSAVDLRVSVSRTNTETNSAGYLGSPVINGNAAYAFPREDSGKTIYHDEAGTRTYTIPANASVAHPIGTMFIISNTGNSGSAGTITLAITSDTLRRADGVSGTGSRQIAANQKATIQKVASTIWEISGTFS